jgi:hypothetical protein
MDSVASREASKEMLRLCGFSSGFGEVSILALRTLGVASVACCRNMVAFTFVRYEAS